MPMTPLDKLNADLQELVKDLTEEQVVTVQKKVAIDVFAGVIKRTPVDEGTARGGWQLGINDYPSTSTKKEKGEVGSPSGPTFDRGARTLGKLGPFKIVWITNAVHYIIVLDQGLFDPADPGPSKDRRKSRHGRILVKGGFSIQAPAGMVDATLASIMD